jgi:DNA invertase Pin-like site-specific DNA recombinase
VIFAHRRNEFVYFAGERLCGAVCGCKNPRWKMIMTVFAGIAEFGRDLIRKRTAARQRTAMKRVVRFGGPAKMTLNHQRPIRRRLLDRNGVRELAHAFKVHPATIYDCTKRT